MMFLQPIYYRYDLVLCICYVSEIIIVFYCLDLCVETNTLLWREVVAPFALRARNKDRTTSIDVKILHFTGGFL